MFNNIIPISWCQVNFGDLIYSEITDQYVKKKFQKYFLIFAKKKLNLFNP